jgi:cytochrome b6-f complex iron-sulfur subunit
VYLPLVPLQLHTRREFCAHACRAGSMLALGAVTGCSGSSTSPSSLVPQIGSAPATVAGRVVSVAVDAASPLAAVGSAVLVRTSLGTFLVAHSAVDTFTALTATCTHEGCGITGFSNSRFVCTCHGSEFTLSGAVFAGPANRALQQYPTQVVNGVLTFRV